MKFTLKPDKMRCLIYHSGAIMSDHDSVQTEVAEGHYEPSAATQDEKADAVAAFTVIVVAILTAINFIYTDGLLAFFENVF